MESVCWGNSTVGSNPTLSAIIFVYDDFNRLAQFINGAGNATKYSYAGFNSTKLTGVINAQNQSLLSNNYDGVRGRLTSTQNGDGATTTFTHNVVSSPQTLRTGSYDVRLIPEPLFLPRNLPG